MLYRAHPSISTRRSMQAFETMRYFALDSLLSSESNYQWKLRSRKHSSQTIDASLSRCVLCRIAYEWVRNSIASCGGSAWSVRRDATLSYKLWITTSVDENTREDIRVTIWDRVNSRCSRHLRTRADGRAEKLVQNSIISHCNYIGPLLIATTNRETRPWDEFASLFPENRAKLRANSLQREFVVRHSRTLLVRCSLMSLFACFRFRLQTTSFGRIARLLENTR